MTRLEKIYRDKPSAEELLSMICTGSNCPRYDGCSVEDCQDCMILWLNEEVLEYDAEFIEKLRAVNILFPFAKYLAQDRLGNAKLYVAEPVVNYCDWGAPGVHWECAISPLDNYAADWEKSLVDIDKVLKECESE